MNQLIVLEGADASGKTTQAALLVEAFKKQQKHVLALKFPRYDSIYGRLITRYLKGELGDLGSVPPHLICLVYAFDRRQAATEIKKTLSAGGIVICDRYTPSNIAHHGARLPEPQQQSFVDFVSKFEYQYLGIPKEHIVVYLHLDPKAQETLIASKHGKDMHEQDPDYRKRVSALYAQLSKANAHWVTINCTPAGVLLPKEAIHAKIVEALHD